MTKDFKGCTCEGVQSYSSLTPGVGTSLTDGSPHPPSPIPVIIPQYPVYNTKEGPASGLEQSRLSQTR